MRRLYELAADERAEMVAQARAIVEARYSIATVTRQHLDLYQRVARS
jgi:glycosyltransferase involved in cell wall biosynthesis